MAFRMHVYDSAKRRESRNSKIDNLHDGETAIIQFQFCTPIQISSTSKSESAIWGKAFVPLGEDFMHKGESFRITSLPL